MKTQASVIGSSVLDGPSELRVLEDSEKLYEIPIFFNAFERKVFVLQDLMELSEFITPEFKKGG